MPGRVIQQLGGALQGWGPWEGLSRGRKQEPEPLGAVLLELKR